MPEWMLWGYAFVLLALSIAAAVDQRRNWTRRRRVTVSEQNDSDPKDDSRA